ncbi:MAG: replicative DNA helicase [Candidatus Nomurabacteria bacterium]|nr:replicative DNA helicase [Candidatus Nomurabacteria bacterium]
MSKQPYNNQNQSHDSQAQKSTMSPLRVPPQDLNSEKALLGSIMLRPVALNDILDIVSEDSFYAEKHRMIFQTMVELSNKGEPIDTVSVSNRLREKNHLDMIGGVSYLADISASVPTSTNVNHYAGVVSRKHLLRELINTGDLLTELGFNEKDDIEMVLDTAEKAVFAVTAAAHHTDRFIGIKTLLPEAWDRIEKLHEAKEGLRGVPTGFKDIDKMLSGLQKSDMILLAGRPSMGKTAFALDIARKASVEHNIPVGFFSLEMSAGSLVDRMLSAQAGVDAWKMRTGTGLKEDDFLKIQDAMSTMSSAPIFIDDQPGNNVLRMRSTARRLKAEHGLGLLIIDYLQLMHPTKNYDSMVNQVSEISRSIKGLARELDVPILALSQLSRAVEARGGKPRLSDLRDSGALEQDADVVMFVHREERVNPDTDRPGVADIVIAKHRNGAVGDVELYFDGDKTSFSDLEKNDFNDFSMGASSDADMVDGF